VSTRKPGRRRAAGLDRRGFLKGSLAAAAWSRVPRLARSSDALRIAVVGLNGRGKDHVEALLGLPDVKVEVLCDVDEAVLEREAKKFRSRAESVATQSDLRRVLENDRIDAITIASPNHWHSLQAIWACQAGKDVYVEKPVSHTFDEGQRLVDAAHRYGRIVQCGTQSRSSQAIAQAIEWVRAGNLGPIRLVRGLCYKPRPSIGHVDKNQRVPDSVDYDLWCGPAPFTPLRRERLHYDWHWIYDTGNGDLGNQGVHQMDIARWVLGARELPASVLSVGGRVGYVDDGQTPNTQLVWLGYEPAPLLFEVRGLPRDKAAQEGDWRPAMDSVEGVSIGVLVHCEGGTLRIPDYSSAIALDADGKELRRWEGATSHFGNWVEALRSRRVEDLHAPIEEGQLSSALCHLGLVSHRLGTTRPAAEIRKALGDCAELSEAFGRMSAHLGANGVDLEGPVLSLGPRLELDAQASGFKDSPAANRLLHGTHREPFVLPEV